MINAGKQITTDDWTLYKPKNSFYESYLEAGGFPVETLFLEENTYDEIPGYYMFYLNSKDYSSTEQDYGLILWDSNVENSTVNFGGWSDIKKIVNDPAELSAKFGLDYIAGDFVLGNFDNNGTVETYHPLSTVWRRRILPHHTILSQRCFELSNVRFLSTKEYQKRWPILIGEAKTANEKIRNVLKIVSQLAPQGQREDAGNFYEKYWGENGIISKLPQFVHDQHVANLAGRCKLELSEQRVINRSYGYSRGDMKEKISYVIMSNNANEPHLDGNELYQLVRRYEKRMEFIAKRI